MSEQLTLDGQRGMQPRKVKPNTKTIDFGVGKMTVTVEPGSSITVVEVVEALESLAMTIPLQRVITALNRLK